MREISVTAYEPGDQLCTVSTEGAITMWTVLDDGALEPGEAGKPDASAGWDNDAPVEELDLTIRPYNVLKREGVNTLGELLTAYDDKSLFEFRNLGSKGIDELTATIQSIRGR